MSILILTGPPGAGKNTVAAAFAQRRERCAVIDVDLVRRMVAQPHHAPWEGAEGAQQHRLGVRNACLLARTFRAHDYRVLIHDVVSPETARLYRRELSAQNPAIVLLLPTFAEIVRRNDSRPPRLTSEQIRTLYRQQATFGDYDHTIDTTALSPEAVAAWLLTL